MWLGLPWTDVLLLVVVAWSAAVVPRGLLVRDIRHEEDGMTQAGPIATVVDVLEELLAGHLDGVVSVTVQPRERRSERWRLLVVVRDRDHAAVPTTHATPATTHAPAPQKGHGGPNEDSIRRTGPSELPPAASFRQVGWPGGWTSLPVPSTPPRLLGLTAFRVPSPRSLLMGHLGRRSPEPCGVERVTAGDLAVIKERLQNDYFRASISPEFADEVLALVERLGQAEEGGRNERLSVADVHL